jgi:predicted Zn-ribbon and HTH transcriptional regulator
LSSPKDRDPDVEEFGNCYCGLYVKKDVFEGKISGVSILERRPLEKQTRAYSISGEAPSTQLQAVSTATAEPEKTKPKLWYCKQCGYVVFREEPPIICPICKAKREFFAELSIEIHGSR